MTIPCTIPSLTFVIQHDLPSYTTPGGSQPTDSRSRASTACMSGAATPSGTITVMTFRGGLWKKRQIFTYLDNLCCLRSFCLSKFFYKLLFPYRHFFTGIQLFDQPRPSFLIIRPTDPVWIITSGSLWAIPDVFIYSVLSSVFAVAVC